MSRRSQHRAPRWLRVTVRVVAAVAALLALYLVVTFAQVWWTSRQDDAVDAQAIVVLGAAQYDGTPSPVFRARLDHALELYEQGLAPTIVVTGGNQPGDRFTEASASADYLVEAGVPAEAILREDEAHNSYDSLVGVRDLLVSRGLTRVLLVSDPFHSLRIRLIAQELGLVAYVSPTRTGTVTGGDQVTKEMKEAAGIALGRIIGFDRLLDLTG